MTKFVMPTVSLEEDYEPTSNLGRPAEQNPFDDTITALKATWSDELKRSKSAATLRFLFVEGERTRVAQKFAKAARAQGYTARFDDKANETHSVEGDKGKTVNVTFGVMAAYLVPIINRTRKNSKVTVSHVSDKQPANADIVDESNDSEAKSESQELVKA